MTFIKCLRIKHEEKGQSALEYFIIFAVMSLVTIWAFTNTLHYIRGSLQGNGGLFQKAVGSEGLNILNSEE